MSYEDSPACHLLATHCCLCGKPLAKGISIERGIGPICAKRYGIDDPVIVSDIQAASIALDESGMIMDFTDPHKAANVLVYRISAEPKGPHVAAMVEAIEHLGYKVLANRLRKRLLKVKERAKAEEVVIPTVTVLDEADTYVVTFKVGKGSPLFDQIVGALQQVPGRRFDRDRTANIIPRASRTVLWQALEATLPKGSLVIGSKGTRTL